MTRFEKLGFAFSVLLILASFYGAYRIDVYHNRLHREAVGNARSHSWDEGYKQGFADALKAFADDTGKGLSIKRKEAKTP